jgi:acetyl esterase/lipase
VGGCVIAVGTAQAIDANRSTIPSAPTTGIRTLSPLKTIALLALVGLQCVPGLTALSQDKPQDKPQVYKTKTDILYRAGDDLTEYMQERCRLDVYYPVDKKNFSTVVWFHGGGLEGGNRFIPAALQEQGVAVVAANYRLHPQVQSPAYVEDAAAAVAWTFKHIAEYGGSPDKIFVSGHSARGYLTSMIGLDKR